MSKIIKNINNFFKKAVKKDIDKINNEIVLSERQQKIFEFVSNTDFNFNAEMNTNNDSENNGNMTISK